MYQTVHEKIQVAGVYNQSKFTPKKFRWQQRDYAISRITLIADTKDGGVRQRVYSVLAGGNVYRLLFNRESEQWWLEEIWCEG